MPSPKKEPPNAAPKPKAIRSGSDTSRVADTAKATKITNTPGRANGSRTPPANARVIQNSHKTGTVSRAAARAAAKRASAIV